MTKDEEIRHLRMENARLRDRLAARIAERIPAPVPQQEPGEAVITNEMVERASKAYAEATGYYVPFHRGLSSASADQIRKGVRAALRSTTGGE